MSPSLFVDVLFPEAVAVWDLDRLYADLAVAKQHALSPTERACLRGLLCGHSPQEIARRLHRDLKGLHVDLSRGLYRYVKAVVAADTIGNWRMIVAELEKLGYKRQKELPADLPATVSDIPAAGIAHINQSASPAPVARADAARLIRHNLPLRDFRLLVGRDRELHQLLEWLSFDRAVNGAIDRAIQCISIEGTGGIGKTTLALAAAHHCLQQSLAAESLQTQPWFDAVIFTSAKQQHFTPHGILPQLRVERSLRDIFRAIGRTLRCSKLKPDFSQQLEQIQDWLSRQRTLLIVDNLEAIDDYEMVLSFLYDLSCDTKIMITSRQQTPFVPLRLTPLPAADSIQLLQQQATLKGLTLESGAIESLHSDTSGIPAAMVYAIGQLAAGYPLQAIPSRLAVPTGDYARFYFESSLMPLRNTLAHRTLMAFALFPGSVQTETLLTALGDCTKGQLLDALAQLQQLSFVNLQVSSQVSSRVSSQVSSQLSRQGDRYHLLPLTREFAILELQSHALFASAIRERWVRWALHFAQTQGCKDWQDWQDNRLLDQEWDNLQEAIEWCISENRYADVRDFWRYVQGYSQTQGNRCDRSTCWDTRRDWAEWLIAAARQQQDWMTALEVMLDLGKTLALIGTSASLAQAATLYQQAWVLRRHKASDFQATLAIQIAYLHIQQEEFAVAEQWLDRATVLIRSLPPDAASGQKQWIHLLYYQGEICYKMQQFERAQMRFQQVLTEAKAMDWQRAVFLAKDWLADIALQRGNLDKADRLLQEGLSIAQQHQDECRAAFCKRSLAQLEKSRGNAAQAWQWAQAAKQSFLQLGMTQEAQETIALLKTLTISSV